MRDEEKQIEEIIEEVTEICASLYDNYNVPNLRSQLTTALKKYFDLED